MQLYCIYNRLTLVLRVKTYLNEPNILFLNCPIKDFVSLIITVFMFQIGWFPSTYVDEEGVQ